MMFRSGCLTESSSLTPTRQNLFYLVQSVSGTEMMHFPRLVLLLLLEIWMCCLILINSSKIMLNLYVSLYIILYSSEASKGG